MPAYHLHYETCEGRCAWCWAPLPRAEPHAVVTAARPPHLRLDLHAPCWDVYRAVSGVDLGPVGSSRDWTPPKIEALRVAAGLTVRAFAKQIGISEPNYRRLLSGDEAVFGPGVRNRTRQLAAVTRYESRSPIDWGDPRAAFCLRMHLKMTKGAFARAVGASDHSVPIWDREGVPGRSVRAWGRLTRLAAKNRFDAAQVVDDRLWTSERLAAAVGASGKSLGAWAAAAGFSYQALQQWAAGTRPIHREAAWGLTRAATEFGVEPPPPGRVGYRKGQWTAERKPLSAEDEARRLDALRESRWTVEALRRLGTMPDREVAHRLGRNRNSVALMRRSLGIPAVDARYWDGAERPCPLSDAEVQRRWDEARARYVTQARSSRRS